MTTTLLPISLFINLSPKYRDKLQLLSICQQCHSQTIFKAVLTASRFRPT